MITTNTVNPVIRARDVSIGFNGVPVLQNFDFNLMEGEIHALTGMNGAGKSTFMKIISGVYTKDSGEIEILGYPIEEFFRSSDRNIQSRVRMVYQDLSLIPSLTVSENIFLRENPYRRGGILLDDAKAFRETRRLLDFIGVSSGIEPDALIQNLSAGQQQLVEIAKALSSDPSILILDEPTASLSNPEIDVLFKVIRRLQEKNISMIYITHYLEDILRLCNRITVLRDGLHIFTKKTKETDLPEIIKGMTGEDSGDKITAPPLDLHYSESKPLLKAENISTPKVKNITLKIYPGEIIGLAGLLGSGRTELLQTIFGLEPAQEGSLFVNNLPVKIDSPQKAISEGIILLPEDRRKQGLILNFSLKQNLILPILEKLKGFFFLKKEKTELLTQDYVKGLKIKTTGILQQVRYLSGGNQQKVVMGKCLASKASLFLLDDPTFGVDIKAKKEIMKTIGGLAKQGKSILFVSSEIHEIASFCHRIYVMKKGEIVEEITEPVNEKQLLQRIQ